MGREEGEFPRSGSFPTKLCLRCAIYKKKQNVHVKRKWNFFADVIHFSYCRSGLEGGKVRARGWKISELPQRFQIPHYVKTSSMILKLSKYFRKGRGARYGGLGSLSGL